MGIKDEQLKDELETRINMSQNKVDLKAMLNEVNDITDIIGDSNSVKVKIFGKQGYGVSPKDELEREINSFISNKDLIDIKFQCVRNFLPHTTMSEFEEIMYAMVLYK